MHTNTHTHMNANSPENGGYLSARRAKIRKQWKAEEQGDCEWNGKDPPKPKESQPLRKSDSASTL